MLRQKLTDRGLDIVDTVTDGNCFFDALRISLKLDESVQQIRQRVVDKIQDMLDLPIVNLSGSLKDISQRLIPLRQWINGSRRYNSWGEYYAYMRQNKNWADDPCIWAAVMVYNVKIEVIVDSTEGSRIFDKLDSWDAGRTSRSIILGNFSQKHFVATAPLDRPPRFGGSGSESSESESESDPEVDLSFLLEEIEFKGEDDMATLLRKGKVEKAEKVERGTCLLVNMYSEAFPTVDDVSEDDWEKFLRQFNPPEVTAILTGFNNYFLNWIKRLKKNKKKMKRIMKPYLDKLADIIEKNLQEYQNQEFLNLLKIDFSHSPLSWEDYKATFRRDYKSGVVNKRLRKAYLHPKEKSVVDVVKRNRLVKCISTAIKIGLNYQELEKFKVKHVPRGEPMTVDDLKALGVELEDPEFGSGIIMPEDKIIKQKDLKKLGLDKVMPFKEAKLKKVLLTDVNNHPYWEKMGGGRGSDLGDWISLWKLRNNSYPQYINPTKRETLTKIYETFDGYDINLDEASPKQLKDMCELDTLKLAPVVHKKVCEYFESGKDGIEEAYRDWQASDRSFKALEDNVRMEDKPFIAPPVIEAPQDFNPDTIGQILEGDFTNLARIIKLHKHDNHEAESKADPLPMSDAPSDAEFARKLSDAFVELGFLPEGYEQYCGVKVGEVRAKRSSDGTVSPAKRPREKLFTVIEIH